MDKIEDIFNNTINIKFNDDPMPAYIPIDDETK